MTASTLTDTSAISCPKCGGQMFDNRLSKKNPKAPDFKCRKRTCEGVIWPPKKAAGLEFPVAQTAAGVSPPANVGAPSAEPKPTMRVAYKSLTEWVLKEIAPIYDAEYGNGEFTPADAAACTATLFIQACKSGKVE